MDATSAVNLLHEYADVFAPGLGKIKGVTAHLDVKDGTAPRFLKPLPVPYTLKSAIEQLRPGTIGTGWCPGESDWATPTVPVPKADRGIRIHGAHDYRVTVNPVLQVYQYVYTYLMPTAEGLFTNLAPVWREIH